jgi:hypothetical protein
MKLQTLDMSKVEASLSDQLAAYKAGERERYRRSFDELTAYLNSCGILLGVTKFKPEQSVEPF